MMYGTRFFGNRSLRATLVGCLVVALAACSTSDVVTSTAPSFDAKASGLVATAAASTARPSAAVVGTKLVIRAVSTTVRPGAWLQLSATVTDKAGKAIPNQPTLTWRSLNTSVANVTTRGTVFGYGWGGTATTITVTAGALTASVSIAVPTQVIGTFREGWCTYQAALMFRGKTGQTPNWSGHAGTWMSNAAAAGWVTTTDPRKVEDGAIIVYAVGRFGHVATAVKRAGGTFGIFEMNASTSLKVAGESAFNAWTSTEGIGTTFGAVSTGGTFTPSTPSHGTYRFSGLILPRKR